MLRLAIVFCKEPVRFYPLVAPFECLAVLVLPQLFEQVHYELWEFECSLRCFGFSSVGIHTATRGIVGCAADADRVVLEVHVFPFKSEHFAPAETAVRDEEEKRAVFVRFVVDLREQQGHFLL